MHEASMEARSERKELLSVPLAVFGGGGSDGKEGNTHRKITSRFKKLLALALAAAALSSGATIRVEISGAS